MGLLSSSGINLVSDLNSKLATLKGKYLERDDETDPGGRIYRDTATGEIYHSVRILSATAPEEQRKLLKSGWSVLIQANP